MAWQVLLAVTGVLTVVGIYYLWVRVHSPEPENK